MIFQENKLIVRELVSEDKFHLAKWLSNPQVLEYYEGRDNPFDIEKVNKKFFNENRGVIGCIVVYDGTSIGYIQYYPLDSDTKKYYGYAADKTIFGIDQFIGEVRYWNKGIGTTLVSSMVNYLKEQMRAEIVVMDPQMRNKRALRCYEKCGFKKVKILPKHELHEGEYQDCCLIEHS